MLELMKEMEASEPPTASTDAVPAAAVTAAGSAAVHATRPSRLHVIVEDAADVPAPHTRNSCEHATSAPRNAPGVLQPHL